MSKLTSNHLQNSIDHVPLANPIIEPEELPSKSKNSRQNYITEENKGENYMNNNNLTPIEEYSEYSIYETIPTFEHTSKTKTYTPKLEGQLKKKQLEKLISKKRRNHTGVNANKKLFADSLNNTLPEEIVNTTINVNSQHPYIEVEHGEYEEYDNLPLFESMGKNANTPQTRVKGGFKSTYNNPKVRKDLRKINTRLNEEENERKEQINKELEQKQFEKFLSRKMRNTKGVNAPKRVKSDELNIVTEDENTL